MIHGKMGFLSRHAKRRDSLLMTHFCKLLKALQQGIPQSFHSFGMTWTPLG